MKAKQIVFRISQIMAIALIFGFILKNLVENWRAVKHYSWQVNYFWLGSSFLLGFLAYLFLVFVWREVLKSSGRTPSLARVYKVWFFSNLGRYLPGKIWTFVSVVYLLEKEGVTAQRSLYTSILAQAMSVISGLILAAIFLGYRCYFKLRLGWPMLVPACVLLFGFITLTIFPKTLVRTINLFLGIFKKQTIDFDLKREDLFRFLTLYALSWFLFGFAFLVFIKSITSLNWNLYLDLTAAFSGSMTLGFLALFAPGGIGVREGILSAILSIYFPLGISVMVSLLSRMWITLIELVCFLTGLAIRPSSKGS